MKILKTHVPVLPVLLTGLLAVTLLLSQADFSPFKEGTWVVSALPEILIDSPDTAPVGVTLQFDISVNTQGLSVQEVLLAIDSLYGNLPSYTVRCQPSVVDREVILYVTTVASTAYYVRVETEIVPGGFGYSIGYVFHVEWKTPTVPLAFVISVTVLSGGQERTSQKIIDFQQLYSVDPIRFIRWRFIAY